MNKKIIPIETYHKGDKITKICVENIHKVIDKVNNALQDAHCNS